MADFIDSRTRYAAAEADDLINNLRRKVDHAVESLNTAILQRDWSFVQEIKDYLAKL